MADETTAAGDTATGAAGTGKPDATPGPGGSAGEPPLVTPKNGAGYYDNSHTWMVQAIMLFVWLLYAMPVVKKFLKAMNPWKTTNKKTKSTIMSPKRALH